MRLILLCEDRAHEDFAKAAIPLRHRRDWRVVAACRDVNSVLAQYPDEVRALRAEKHQKQLGLVVLIDADDAGSNGRRIELDAELEKAKAKDDKHRGRRERDEPIALLVPARNVETWIKALVEGPEGVDETQDFKTIDRSCKAGQAGERFRALDPSSAEAHALDARLPALAAARSEIERLPR